MASESVHIPHNHVTKFEWSSDDENATISFATETGGETEDQTMDEENDDIDNTHDVGDIKVSSASVQYFCCVIQYICVNIGTYDI